MIYLLTGENDFLIRREVVRTRDEFIKLHSPDAFEQRDGQSLTLAELPQLFKGASLFSPKKLIVIYGTGVNKEVWDSLDTQLPEDEDTDVLLVEQKPDMRTRTYKWLLKHAQINRHDFLSEGETTNWINISARELGINLAPDVVRFLISHIGTDQWRLSQELNKLSLSRKPITQDLIRDIVDPNPHATAFELLDAVIAGKRHEARTLISIVSRVEDPYRFVGLLTGQVYALAVCHAAGDRSSAVIAKDAGVHPYVASKTQAIARRIGKEKLRSIVETIAELDDMLKSTGGDPWLLIESSLNKIAAR